MNRKENSQHRRIGAGLVLALALSYPGINLVGSQLGLGFSQSAYAEPKGGNGGGGGRGAPAASPRGAPARPAAPAPSRPAPPMQRPIQSPRQDTMRREAPPVVSLRQIDQQRPIDQATRVDQQYRQAVQAAQAAQQARAMDSVRRDTPRASEPYVGREIDRRTIGQADQGSDRQRPPQPRPIDRGRDTSAGGGDRNSDRGSSTDKPSRPSPVDPTVKPIPFDDDRPVRDNNSRDHVRGAGKPGIDDGRTADRMNRGSSRDPVTVWSGRDGRRSSFAPSSDKPRNGSSVIVDQATIRNRMHRDSTIHSEGFDHHSHHGAFAPAFHDSCFSSRHFCDPVCWHHPCFSFGFCNPCWPSFCNDGFGFFFSTSSCFSFGFSFSNFNSCFDPCYGPVHYNYFYDDCRPVYSCWSDCDWYWGRPVYGCYRPRVIYRPAYVYDSYYAGAPYYYDSYSSGYDSGIAGTYPPEPGLYSTSEDGWDLLINGDAREARRVFDRALSVHTNDALSQIGYSIAAGMLGRYDDAVASMRKALRDDPKSLNEVPENSKLDASLRQLLDHYAAIVKQSPGDIDSLFMSAALRYLVDDAALAYFAADQALTQGDRDPSAQNLKRLIQTSLQKHDGGTGNSSQPATDAPLSLPAPMAAPAATVAEVSY